MVCAGAVFLAQFAGDVRVAVTGVSENGVFRWPEAEVVLIGTFHPASLERLQAPARGMFCDLHGSPEYRAHLVGVLTKRAVLAAH